MNNIILAIVMLTVLPILASVLLGLLRGSRRSLLRLGLVLVSLVLAFALCGVVANALLGVDVSRFVEGDGSMTVSEYLQQILLSDIPDGVTTIALAIVQSMVKVVVFLLLFLLFRFLTWAIAYPICKIFVKPKTVHNPDGSTGKKKRRLIGSVFGLVQGVVVAACVCVVMTGLLVQTNKIVVMANDLEELAGGMQTMSQDDGIRVIDEDTVNPEQPSDNPFDDVVNIISEYVDSGIGKFYNDIGAKPFNWLSTVKNANDNRVTLSGQIDAIRGVVDMAKELMNFQNINFEDLFAEGNVDAIRDIFNALQNINDNLSKESKDTIKSVIADLGDELGLPIDLSDVDFNEIDFSEEGEAFTKLLEYRNNEKIEPDDVEDILENIVNSSLILDVLGSNAEVDIGSQLKANDSEEYLNVIEDKIAEMETSGKYDQDKIDSLKIIFGMNA